MCLSTCAGGIDRKPINVTFTLENDGNVLGRQIVRLKVCAAPGRDRKAEELKFGREFAAPVKKEKLTKVPKGKRKETPRMPEDDDESELETLKLPKSVYKLIKPIAEALVLAEASTSRKRKISKEKVSSTKALKRERTDC